MNIKFIHTADIHLGCKFNNASFPRSIAKSRREEMWSTFLEIIALAQKENVHFLLISGDLFESSLIGLGELKRINQAFQSISKTRVIISPGNHDTYSEKTPYRLVEWAENVHVFQEKKIAGLDFQDLNTVVYGFAWKEKYIEEEFQFPFELLDERKNNILMLHGDVYNRKSRYLPINKDHLNKLHFDYVALGHVHKPDVLEDHIRYSGSPEPLDFGEPGRRGVLLGEIKDKKFHGVFVPLSRREFIVEEVHLTPEMSYQDMVDKLKSYPGKGEHLYRLNLSGLVDGDILMDELISEVSKEFYYVEINNHVRPDYDLEKLLIENSHNIIGSFIKEMKKNNLEEAEVKNALYFGLQALLKEKVE